MCKSLNQLLFIYFTGETDACRRLHATGKSGWWILISLIPLIRRIIILIFTLMDSETGSKGTIYWFVKWKRLKSENTHQLPQLGLLSCYGP
ncbi:DUF805 domain-containing protein [Sporosarcina globispora]|uniref:DUF805 domain-containing protein n=1 Tax=Sporosarcina globispora TaxID=1459 RepID=UPI0009E8B95F